MIVGPDHDILPALNRQEVIVGDDGKAMFIWVIFGTKDFPVLEEKAKPGDHDGERNKGG